MIMPISFAMKTTASVVTTLGVLAGGGIAIDDRYTSANELKSSQSTQNYVIVAQLRDFRIRYVEDRIQQLGTEQQKLMLKKSQVPDAYTATDQWRENEITDDIKQLQQEKTTLDAAKQKAIDQLSEEDGE